MTQYSRRRFLRNSLAASLSVGAVSGQAWAAPASRPVGANDDIRLAIVGLGQVGPPGVGGRGRQLIDLFRQTPGARIVAICDVDTEIMAREKQRFTQWNEPVETFTDMRKILDGPDIDAVVIATPNHWHALATVWACQAGKDVYVEKPASHSVWEGRQMVAAARKYDRIVQVGTQARSSDVSQQAAEYVQSGRLGKIRYGHVVVYRRRTSIGRAGGPLVVPSSVNYDLWLGPARDEGLTRRVFHYDWHWQWPTGNGEIGNNGVHQLDRCRWMLGHDALPRRALSAGGRFTFNDDGQTPNTQIALLEYEAAPIFCEIRGLPEKLSSEKMDRFRSISVGLIIQCEGGALIAGRDTGTILDNDGKEIAVLRDRQPAGQAKTAHQVDFIGAVRSRRASDLNAEIQEGHVSATLCHMANVSYRLGSPAQAGSLIAACSDRPQWDDVCDRFERHLAANGVGLGKTPATVGPWVTLDPKAGVFVGDMADQANALSRRDYRKPFVVPELS